MANTDNWITSRFTKDQLDGKMVYFTLKPGTEKFFGHLHVEENGEAKFRITIDYGGPDSSGQIQSGTWMVDQSFADNMRELAFIVP